MSGEAIRGRLFLTADAAGEELCLRPEYTIPVCRAYLASDKAGAVAEYCLSRAGLPGPGRGRRRTRPDRPRKLRPQGRRSGRRRNLLACDGGRRRGGRKACGAARRRRPVRCALTTLALPEVWRRRLKRGLAQGRDLAAILDGRGQSALAQPGVLAAMESADHEGARALVEDLLAIAGIDAVGGRSPSEIADRFLEQAALRSGDAIGVEKRQVLESYLAVSGDPDVAADKLGDLAARPGSTSAGRSTPSSGATASSPPGASRSRRPGSPPPSCATSTITQASCSRPATQRGRRRNPRLPAAAMTALRASSAPRRTFPRSARRSRSTACRPRERADGPRPRSAEAPFVLAVPSKGRLQENASAFFARAGLELTQGRGARDYRGAVAGLPGVEVAFLSASEIVGQLAAGAAHFGVTGEDLVREKVPDADARLELIAPLGFGRADVVVAAPQAWIDVRSMADLEDVASAYRARRGERMRVATKYVNLTRRYFAEHGVGDYRIVESLGATEGAPAAGRGGADRRHHHHRRDARGQCAETAGRRADPALAGDAGRLARRAMGAGATQKRPHHPRPDRGLRGGAQVARGARPPAGPGERGFRRGASTLRRRPRLRRGAPIPRGFVALHCAKSAAADLASYLLEKGAERVSVVALEHVFDARNPLYEVLEKRIGPGEG